MLTLAAIKASLVKARAWCKANWKFLLGAAIPVVLMIIFRKGDYKAVWEAGKKAKDDELEAVERTLRNESRKKTEAAKSHIEEMNAIREDEKNRIESAKKEADQLKDDLNKGEQEELTKRLAELSDSNNLDS